MAGLEPARLSGHEASDDLSALLDRAIDDASEQAPSTTPRCWRRRRRSWDRTRAAGDKTVVLLDIAIGSKSEAAFIHAVIAAAQRVDRHDPSR